MDVREKLVELIAQKVCETWSGTCDQWLPHDCGKCYANDCHISEIADYLISNGVTVQEWISVKDRLPTEDEDRNHRIIGVVNGYNGKIRFTDAEIFVRYCHTENAWWSDDYDIDGCAVEKFYVLPQPQKGGDENG